jgi:hypothetical protein
MDCGLFQIATTQCNLGGNTTLNAPLGFQSYVWKDSSLSTTIGNGQSITIATPSSTKTYKVIMTPYAGYGCPDTLTTLLTITNLSLSLTRDTAICAGTSVLLQANVSGGLGQTNIVWTPSTGLSCYNCASPTALPTSTTKYYVNVSDSSGCSRIDSVKITLKPLPTLSSTLTPPAICNNTLFGYTPTSTTSPVSYSWTRSAISGIANPTAYGIDSVSEVLNNTTANPITVGYAFLLSAAGCTNVENVDVVVNPTPMLSSLLNPPAICNGTAFAYTPTSGTAGTTFSWTRAAVYGISNAANFGSGTISEVLYDTVSVPENVTYHYTLTANGCTNTSDIIVTVKPTPAFTSSLNPGAICNNTVFNYTPLSNVSGASFSWQRAVVVGISNAAASGTGNISEVLNNTTANPIVVSYTYTITANGCSNTATLTVTVNPTPMLSSSSNGGTICSGNLFNYSPTSGTANTSYSWTRATVYGIQNAAGTGTGGISEILTDTLNTAVNVTYTYSLSANGCNDTQSIHVTVNPTPSLSSTLSPASICSNTLFSYSPTSNVAGASFTWTRAVVSGISNAAGNGTGAIYEVLVNTTTAPVNVYYVYSISAAGCVYNQTIHVVVKPYAVSPTATSNSPVCSGDTLYLFAQTVTSGVSYSWYGPGGFTSNLQNPIISNMQSAQAGTYAAVINLNGCLDTAFTTVAVHVAIGPPTVTISAVPGDTACLGALITLSAACSNSYNTLYQWYRNGNAIAGASNPSYSSTGLASGDIITCKIKSNGVCQQIDTALSNALHLYLIAYPPPSIYLSEYSSGNTHTFTCHINGSTNGLRFQWKKNGIFISGASNSFYSSNQLSNTDTICVVVYSTLACTVPDSSVACMTIPEALPNTSASLAKISLYPNPMSNELIIEGAVKGTRYRLVNVAGQIMIKGVIGSNPEKVDTHELVPGNYLLEFEFEDGSKLVYKVSK